MLTFNIFIDALSLGLQFPTKWLTPVYTGIEDVSGLDLDDPLPDPFRTFLSFNVGSLGYSSERGFQFNQANTFSINRSIIGKTGLIVDFQGLKVDLSRDSNIPEADYDDRPPTFMGAFAQYASITLPARWFNSIDNTTLRIAGYNLLIGTGGISGTIGIETVNGTPSPGDDYLDMKIGNWEIGFNHFAMNFKQNVITDSHIAGRLKIPKLKDAQGNDAIVYVNGHLNETGDFNLTASEPEGIPFHIFDFVTINMQTIELGRQDDLFYLGASAEIWFDNALMNKLLGGQKITVPKIRIYENGKFEIVGGASTIPANITLNLGPVEVAVNETR